MRKGDVDMAALEALVGRILPPAGGFTIERTAEGGSTQVYRIRRRSEVFYLRAAEERAANLSPEAYVHEILHRCGVKVPAVIYFDPFSEAMERSIMVTTEIPGEAIWRRPVEEATQDILRAAGRDLAIINSAPVHGFGWIKRESSTIARLEAVKATYRQFVLEHIDEHLALLSQQILTKAEVTALDGIIARYGAWLQVEQAWLAHGDLDVTHIYQQDGCYTGIIDFGEIRGADRLYDLAHFNLHDGERLPQLLLPALLEGYMDVVQLPPDYELRIGLVGVLIGVRALAGSVQRHPPNAAYQRHLVSAIQRASVQLEG